MITKPLTMLENLPEWVIGHERLFDDAVRIFNNAVTNYPPHNLIKNSNTSYVITMAVAGFSKEELSVTSEEGNLIIKADKKSSDNKDYYIFRGIANRAFSKEFLLAENIFVKDVSLNDGILSIELEKLIPDNEKETVYTIN
jgi:molecular chaperone IbpA